MFMYVYVCMYVLKETVKPEFDSNSNHHFVNAKYLFLNTYQLNMTLMY